MKMKPLHIRLFVVAVTLLSFALHIPDTGTGTVTVNASPSPSTSSLHLHTHLRHRTHSDSDSDNENYIVQINVHTYDYLPVSYANVTIIDSYDNKNKNHVRCDIFGRYTWHVVRDRSKAGDEGSKRKIKTLAYDADKASIQKVIDLYSQAAHILDFRLSQKSSHAQRHQHQHALDRQLIRYVPKQQRKVASTASTRTSASLILITIATMLMIPRIIRKLKHIYNVANAKDTSSLSPQSHSSSASSIQGVSSDLHSFKVIIQHATFIKQSSARYRLALNEELGSDDSSDVTIKRISRSSI
jgi:hypothetical protein